jgi:hypothetical protein
MFTLASASLYPARLKLVRQPAPQSPHPHSGRRSASFSFLLILLQNLTVSVMVNIALRILTKRFRIIPALFRRPKTKAAAITTMPTTISKTRIVVSSLSPSIQYSPRDPSTCG